MGVGRVAHAVRQRRAAPQIWMSMTVCTANSRLNRTSDRMIALSLKIGLEVDGGQAARQRRLVEFGKREAAADRHERPDGDDGDRTRTSPAAGRAAERVADVPLRQPVRDQRIGGGEQRDEDRAEGRAARPSLSEAKFTGTPCGSPSRCSSRQIADELERPADQEPADVDESFVQRAAERAVTPSAKQPMPSAAISTDMTLKSSRLGSRAATRMPA